MFLFTLLFQFMQLHQPVDTLKTPYEKGNGNQTCTYEECIDWYKQLDQQFDDVQLQAHGTTSVGKPIHLLVIDKRKRFNPESTRSAKQAIMLINNGIHPGEPDGIDASMMLVRDLLTDEKYASLLEHTVLLVIPSYNISGMLNRGLHSRVNQKGPEEYGFRGNRQNLDLNRDFIKCDSKEAETFNKIFAAWQPQMFVDTHVSNGADYQYTMTHIQTHPDKLHPTLAKYQLERYVPELEKRMTQAGWEMIPYVNTKTEIPDDGIVAFLETGRYSTGYTALHHSIGSMPETHMLKPYAERVQSTYQYLLQTLMIVAEDHTALVENQEKAFAESMQQSKWNIRWQLDESKVDTLRFKGYEAAYKPSNVTGEKRLYYDRTKPFEKDIPYYNSY
ncbi:MAG TPA: M14 family zinc carboxypeptidase, partial [Chitinophagales bacterium]|nr:M14 family zinc carboxypeptidase [Chitinophagales bacterium]